MAWNLPASTWRCNPFKRARRFVSCPEKCGNWAVSVQLLVSTGWKIRLLQQTQYEQVMPEGNLIPYYKNEILEQCKGSELKEIWKEMGIRARDKKEGFIPNLNTSCHHVSTVWTSRTCKVGSRKLKDSLEMHICIVLCAQHFNYVYLGNRSWYSVEEHHHNR